MKHTQYKVYLIEEITMTTTFKIGDTVMLPRFANYNPKYDRDRAGKIREVRQGRLTSYRIGKLRYLEAMLRPVNWNTLTLMAEDQND